MKERRPMSQEESEAASCLQQVTYPVASWDKRFARSLSGLNTITDNEAPQVWRLFKRYRRQIIHPNKAQLLTIAEQKSAPDFRKTAAQIRAQEELDRYKLSMQNKEQTSCTHPQ